PGRIERLPGPGRAGASLPAGDEEKLVGGLGLWAVPLGGGIDGGSVGEAAQVAQPSSRLDQQSAAVGVPTRRLQKPGDALLGKEAIFGIGAFQGAQGRGRRVKL